MELWLDTINFNLIEKAIKQLSITGVTTNPCILSHTKESCDDTIKRLLDIQPGLLAVQVTSSDEKIMLEQAHRLRKVSERIIVKVPVFENGLYVIRQLGLEYIPTMATAILETSQIYLSMLSGAKYAAPYLGKIEINEDNSSNALHDMLRIVKIYGSPLKILAASIRTKQQILKCLLLGVQAITLSEQAYIELISDNSITMRCLENFRIDWSESQSAGLSSIFR